jgi:hypothetical protein
MKRSLSPPPLANSPERRSHPPLNKSPRTGGDRIHKSPRKRDRLSASSPSASRRAPLRSTPKIRLGNTNANSLRIAIADRDCPSWDTHLGERK